MVRFSIVLTTTDRPSLLPAGVRAVLESDFEDFELIVSDNFSRTPAARILTDVRDGRLRIIRTDRRLTAPDHWEFAWDHVRAQYVIFLGDDNALHPGTLTLADRAIRDHDLDIVSWRVCTYYHPGWDIVFGPLPDRGNILGLDVGTTGQLYRCHPRAVIENFCRDLRMSGCFPCMLNFLFRKSLADDIRRRIGRFFWAPNPDITMGYLALGVARDNGYGFFDRFGAIGGRSKDSNLASLLSRGKGSRRAYDYVAEFRDLDLFPHHEPKFIGLSNSLAATVSQAKTLMPDRFADFDFDRVTLARKSIDDMYVERTIPWVDDPQFITDFNAFLATLPASAAAEMASHRDESRARAEQSDASPSSEKYVRNADDARISLIDFMRKASLQEQALAWRLFRDVRQNPLGRYWGSGGTSYLDMTLYGGRDIADAARGLSRILAIFDRPGGSFVDYHRRIGMLGESIAGARSPGRPGLEVVKPVATVQ